MEIDKQDIIDTALGVIEIEADSIRKLSQKIDSSFTKALELLYKCKNYVIITGVGKSAHIGKKIAATMTSTGTPAIFMHASEAIHGDLGIANDGVAVLAISYSGETEEVLKLIPTFKRFSIPIVSITGNKCSTLAEQADVNIDIAIEREACPNGLAPTASTTATLAMGDAIAMCLLKAKKFSHRDFATFHPGGSLGRKLLTTVKDIMRTGERIPAITSDSTVKEALFEITGKCMGMTTIVEKSNKILGVFTDGDIRRCFNNNINIDTAKISDVMSKNFKSVKGSTPISEVIKMMETHKIYCLPVVDDNNRIIGAFNMHDLIDAKLI